MRRLSALSKTAPSKVYSAPAVQRAILVLEHIAKEAAEPTLSTLARDLGLNKSTLYGLLGSLEKFEWVEKTGRAGGYRLGTRVLELSMRCAHLTRIVDAAMPWMHRLSRAFGETVFLGEHSANHIVVRAVVEGQNAVHLTSNVGTRLPTPGTVFKTILCDPSTEAQPDRGRAVDGSRHLAPNVRQLRPDFLCRAGKDYAVDHEEHLRGVRCAAAPVRQVGAPVFVLWVQGLGSLFSWEGAERAGVQLAFAAQHVGAQLNAARAHSAAPSPR